MEAPVVTSAVLRGAERRCTWSPCRAYRYSLLSKWGDGLLVNFLLLNPSTADALQNDPTVERCERRARAWGFAGLYVTNLFAYRATDPKAMKDHAEPIGPDNDAAILNTAEFSALVVCAWGNDGAFKGRSRDVLALLQAEHGDKLHALRISKTGEPYHPLYVPYAVTYRPIEVLRKELAA